MADAEIERSTGEFERVPIVAGQPALVDFSSSIVPREWYTHHRKSYSLFNRRRDWTRQIKALITGCEGISRRNYVHVVELMTAADKTRPTVLMVGAGQQGAGTDLLYDKPNLRLIAFDVYPTHLTNLIADAHRIPLCSGSVDAVCIQAVLEHVLDPVRVVAEIFRVLKPGGLVYAETPFMQQVHEGAYDFLRFSELGHRWLFRNFVAIDRGANGGPGLSVYWAMKYFLSALTRNRMLGSVLALPFLPFALFDRVIPLPHRIDGANGVYFLGRKENDAETVDTIIAGYLGAQG